MNHKYIVQLTDEECQELCTLVQKGKPQGYQIKHAQILLKLDETDENQEWTYDSLCPVVCLDETNRQLIEKRSIPSKPGSPEREDYLVILQEDETLDKETPKPSANKKKHIKRGGNAR